MDELKDLITLIDNKILGYQVGLASINPAYNITLDVATVLTNEFINDLKEIKAKLLQND